MSISFSTPLGENMEDAGDKRSQDGRQEEGDTYFTV